MTKEQRHGEGAPSGPVRGESWFSQLVAGADRREGRLKGGTLRTLVVVGLCVLLGVALMGLSDLFKARPGSASPGVPVNAAPEETAPVLGAGLESGSGDGAGAVWVGVADLEAMMERTLERILSRIDGAGEVAVAVSLDTGATYVYGYDESQTTETTEEHDASGGSRIVTQSDTSRTAVVVSQSGASGPVVVRVELPPIKGVVVVASGANDSRVKALLGQAVQTLYGVPAHRVAVLGGR